MIDRAQQSGKIYENVSLIETYLCSYMGYSNSYFAKDFVTSLSTELLSEICPSALNLPAALIVQDDEETSFVSIHLRHDLYKILDSDSIGANMLADQKGLGTFLILIEEISHFHHYTRHAESGIRG